jgi:putative Mg2+ transporter-C (MgtC) family protein
MDISLHINETISLLTSAELAFTGQFIFSGLLALIFAYVIGRDRERKEKPAGIVTHAFVILGSLMFTMLSQLDPINPARIAANIVTGIGFLGAGMILKSDDKVENLTTAAGVWVSAAIGMALGYKMYIVACVAVFMMFMARFLPHPYREKKDGQEEKD